MTVLDAVALFLEARNGSFRFVAGGLDELAGLVSDAAHHPDEARGTQVLLDLVRLMVSLEQTSPEPAGALRALLKTPAALARLERHHSGRARSERFRSALGERAEPLRAPRVDARPAGLSVAELGRSRGARPLDLAEARARRGRPRDCGNRLS